MSTRTYTLIFNAPGEQPLPQGVFFMVKSAAAALTITANRRDAQPVVFENVGAGLQFNGLQSGVKWSQLIVESQTIQTVEIVVSDDASVSFANVVTVSGGVSVVVTPSPAINTPAAVPVNNGVSGAVPANASRRSVSVCNPSTNDGSFWVMDANNASPRGSEVQPGTEKEYPTTGALFVRNDSGGTQSFTYTENF